MPALKDLTGQKIGRLTVLRLTENNRGRPFWECRCDCGVTKVFAAANLRTGNTRSCGCLRKELLTKHGDFKSPEYSAWAGMLQRCYNPKAPNFKYWGGKGITVCNRWRTSYENFLADMGRRPVGLNSLDRIDPAKNYEPGNCRWLSRSENTSRAAKGVKKAKYRGEPTWHYAFPNN